MERGFTIADQIARTTSYQLHFVEPWQLWNSTWGFGGSAVGVEDGMSFKLGKIQIILGLLGMATAIYKKNRQLILLSLFLLASFWLTTASSRFLWDASSTLQIVQFPWRTLGLLAFYLSILTGYLVSQIGSQQARRGFAVVSVVALLFLNLKYFTPQSIVASPLDNPNIDLTQIEDISTVVPEFMPVWLTKSNLNIIGSTVLPYAYYPTWEVELDGRPAMTYPSASGQLAFNNPANSSNYLVRQSHTRLENISLLVSLLALIIAIKFYVKK
jgi:hypothetical protein